MTSFSPPLVCVSCAKGSKCCKKVFKKCVCKYPVYDKCCSKITDPSCQSANAACEGYQKTAKASVSTAKGVVNSAKSSLDVANAALVSAQGVVNAASKSLDVANLALEAAKETYKLGSEAANIIAQVGLNGLITIREFSFDVSLSEADGGSFAGSARARFAGGAEVSVKLNIDLRDITSMAKQLANHIGSGLSDIF